MVAFHLTLENIKVYRLYSSFAIKCGGGDALKVDKIVYEVDGYDLGGASFVVLDIEKWAVSDAGWYPDGKFNTHVQNTGSQGTGTTIPELYRISRQSPGSLRYYKLSLENGPYNVSLSFAFGDQGSLTWKSHGRHVFDIYIQGTLRSKDFDISKKAGTCCIPTGGSYGPLISALSVIPDFTPTVGIARKKNQTWLVVVLLGIGPKPKTFSYAELGSATKDFKSPNKLGEGGFGPVYKAWSLHESTQSLGLIDPKITEFNEIEALRVIAVALLCTQASPALRPAMSRVLSMLAGDIEVGTVTSKPSYLTDWNQVNNTAPSVKYNPCQTT
ncbi:hypothetical protein Pint_11554 [Pistacia integerrima]|uniref:Uncharacterized protein n=1 Tax=Pistacia integerrima TaxID=434235 RepID=A0ACC0XHX2_9ROSI|nr:hypothetical protein Pint_11554 [Pistacia integerrima]